MDQADTSDPLEEEGAAVEERVEVTLGPYVQVVGHRGAVCRKTGGGSKED